MNCSYKVDNRSRRICDESGSRKVSGSIDENPNHPGNTNDRPIFTRCDPVCNEHTHTRTGVDRPTDTRETHTDRRPEGSTGNTDLPAGPVLVYHPAGVGPRSRPQRWYIYTGRSRRRLGEKKRNGKKRGRDGEKLNNVHFIILFVSGRNDALTINKFKKTYCLWPTFFRIGQPKKNV